MTNIVSRDKFLNYILERRKESALQLVVKTGFLGNQPSGIKPAYIYCKLSLRLNKAETREVINEGVNGGDKIIPINA